MILICDTVKKSSEEWSDFCLFKCTMPVRKIMYWYSALLLTLIFYCNSSFQEVHQLLITMQYVTGMFFVYQHITD